jgi:hypothetical protein
VWIRKASYDDATASTTGTVSYGPLYEERKYLYGGWYSGESNYSYNKYGGEHGAFSIDSGGDLLNEDEDELKAVESAAKRRKKQEATAAATAAAKEQGLVSLRGSDKQVAFAETLRQRILTRFPNFREVPEVMAMSEAEWWIEADVIVGCTPLACLGSPCAAEVVIVKSALDKAAKEAERKRLTDHPLCADFPGRVTSVTSKEIRIKTEYGELAAQKVKAIGGKWNREMRRWVVPLEKEEDVRRILGQRTN